MYKFLGSKDAHMILFENALSPGICEEIIEFGEALDKRGLLQKGQTVNGVNEDIKATEDWIVGTDMHGITPEDASYMSYFDRHIYSAVSDCFTSYSKNYSTLSTWTDIWDSGYRVQRYRAGHGFYKPHIDGAPWIRDRASKRVVAVIMYLNTIENGGCTRFEMQEIDVKPVAGSLLMFPATWTHPHESTVSPDQDKWVISSFMTTEQI